MGRNADRHPSHGLEDRRDALRDQYELWHPAAGVWRCLCGAADRGIWEVSHHVQLSRQDSNVEVKKTPRLVLDPGHHHVHGPRRYAVHQLGHVYAVSVSAGSLWHGASGRGSADHPRHVRP